MTIARRLLAALSALLIAAPVFAQAQRIYSQPELDQMLAPIALYPDALLSQILMAATYPAEVTEAARWSRANPGLQGDDAVRAVQNEDWDPSVKSLVAFPQVLARMDENQDWTRSLGEAFLAQEPYVMDTVQQLRQRAQTAGNLQSSAQVYVQQQGQAILVQPADPQYVYVPYYDPMVVYGSWWWPAYPPVVWAPWPGYSRPYRPGVSATFWWGTPVGLSLNFFFGNFDWRHQQVRVAHPTAYYYRQPVVVNRAVVVTPHRWQHDSIHRQEERRFERQAAPAAVQVPPAARIQAQPRVQPQRQARPQPEARPQLQVRQAQQRPSMPAAQAPQTPRAERQERREQRHERREERGQKAG